MPRDIRSVNPMPLTATEEAQLMRLLDRSGQSLSEAQARHDKERAKERKLQAKRDKLAAEESRLSKRLAELRIDLDVVSGEIYKLAPSGVAFRFVNERLQQLAEIAPKQSYFNTPHDTLDREQLKLLGEIGLAMFEEATRPKGKGKSLRQRMEGIKAEAGLDGPNAQAPPDDRAALAQAIINAGRKRRGETQ